MLALGACIGGRYRGHIIRYFRGVLVEFEILGLQAGLASASNKSSRSSTVTDRQ